MRLTIATPAILGLLALAALSGCGAAAIGSKGESMTLDQVCAEQSAMAQAGTTDGGQITITCP